MLQSTLCNLDPEMLEQLSRLGSYGLILQKSCIL